jgi:hypothetical protein
MHYANQQPFPSAVPSKSCKKDHGLFVQGNTHISQIPQPEGVSPSYHRRLVEVAAVGVVLGVVFLLFWQGVLRAPPSVEFVEDYCTDTLGHYVTADIAANANFDVGQDGRLAACSVSGDSVQGLVLSWSGTYDCNDTTVRYKAEENPNWLSTVIETETPELVYFNETLIANLSGLARFSYSVIVYNPAARSSFDGQLELLRTHSCEI